MVWLTTHLKRRESAVSTLMNAEKMSRERDERSHISFKRCGCAMETCAVTSQRTPRGLCASTIELSLRLYCNYALLVLVDANGALVAMLKTLWRCHGDPISFLLCVYQNAERAMCMLKVRAVPWRSRRSTATKRTPLRCRTLLREPWRFPVFRTQQECLGDAAPV